MAFLGVIFLALLLALAVTLLFVSVDLSDFTAPTVRINGTPVSPPDLGALETLVNSPPIIERNNPLETQALPPTATLTPVPPLDPAVYRTEVMIRANNFGAALQTFLEANEQLAENEALLDDPAWQGEMRAILDQVDITGLALATVDPPPAEYQAIDVWLKRVGPEAEALRENYLTGMETRDTHYFTAASDNLTRIREYLVQALEAMGQAGWPMEE